MKDWTGNKQSVFATLAANNHSDIKREDDAYENLGLDRSDT